MSYTVLARRYRSDTFDEVIGQEAVSRTLKNAIETDHVAHAYIFNGTRGVGKTTMARILAKALNCLNSDNPTATPCLKCESCTAISEGADIDVIEIDGASTNGVDHIRELRQNAIYRPARARFKIYIIDEVHMLSNAAFNALLKTLEEPPPHVKFILATTEPNKILPTILSRCQRFDFRSMQVADVVLGVNNILKGEGLTAEDALVRRVGRLANGSMRDALSLLDQLLSMEGDTLTLEMLYELLGSPRVDGIIELATFIGDGELANALEKVDALLQDGMALEQLAESLQMHFRDLLILKSCGKESELVALDEGPLRDKAISQSTTFDEATLVYYITICEELKRAIKTSNSSRAIVEATIVRLATPSRFSDTKKLLEQVQQLQSAPTVGQPAAPPPRQAQRPQPTRQAMHPTTTAPHPPATTSASAPAPAQNTNMQQTITREQITLDYIKTNWLNLLNAFSAKGLIHYFKLAVPTKFADNTLDIHYPPNISGVLKMLHSQPEKIKEAEIAFGEVLKGRVTLSLTTNAPQTNTAKPVTPTAAPATPGAKLSQNEIREAMNDPAVKQVQELLGGKVKQIKKMDA